MANELTHNSATGLNFYACRFQTDGDVFITDGSADEVWATGGHTADDYDVAMTEEASSGHYKADFDAGTNIGAGVYQVVIYLRVGANPADSDPPVAQGEIYWDGTAEINESVIDTVVDTILTDTNEIQGKLPTNYIMGSDDQSDHNAELEDWADGGRLDNILDGIGTDTDTIITEAQSVVNAYDTMVSGRITRQI